MVLKKLYNIPKFLPSKSYIAVRWNGKTLRKYIITKISIPGWDHWLNLEKKIFLYSGIDIRVSLADLNHRSFVPVSCSFIFSSFWEKNVNPFTLD